MADWYVSSAAYSGYTAFATSHAYSIGDIVKPTAPAAGAKYVFRCSTAGTSSTEPTWPVGNNATVTTGGATFTNITAQSSFFWTAAAGDYSSISTFSPLRFAIGDRIFISSDHTETASGPNYGSGSLSGGYGVLQILSVNRAGSTPPVAADLAAGATMTANSSGMGLVCSCEVYHYGINYINTSSGNVQLGSFGGRAAYFKNCSIYLNNNSAVVFLVFSAPSTTTFDNTTIQFGHVGQTFSGGAMLDITWINTPSALPGAIFPTVLFTSASTPAWVTLRGVDLSAYTKQLVGDTSSGIAGKYLFESCKIASSVTRYPSISSPASAQTRYSQVDLINCYDGTHVISETWSQAGAVTTEFTITLSGGAQDDIGAYAHKMVSNVNADKFSFPLAGFWMDMNYTATGSPKTATVEIISSSSLNNDDIALYLEYAGTAGSPVTSFANSFIATPLTTAAAVPTSTATWNSSPATPVKQKLQVTFTPQTAGRLRGQVRLGKASATVYVNPQIVVT